MPSRRIKTLLEAEDRASPKVRGLSTSIKGLGAIAAAVGAVQLGRKLVQGMQAAIDKAAEQEKQERTLQAALVSTGRFSDELFASLKRQASALQNLTAVGDETILQVQALLVQFGVAGDEVSALAESTLDLATTFKIDYLSAATLVAKAVAGNVGALSRYGIAIDAADVKTRGATAVLDELQKTMGGRAAAQADTFAGSMDKLTNALGDTQEMIAGPLIEAGKALVDEIFLPLSTELNANAPLWDKWRDSVLDAAIGVVSLAVTIESLINKLSALKAVMIVAFESTAQKVEVGLLAWKLKITGVLAEYGVLIGVVEQARQTALTAGADVSLPNMLISLATSADEADSALVRLLKSLVELRKGQREVASGGGAPPPIISAGAAVGAATGEDAFGEPIGPVDPRATFEGVAAIRALEEQNALEILDIKIAAAEEYSDEWILLQQQRLEMEYESETAAAEAIGASRASTNEKFAQKGLALERTISAAKIAMAKKESKEKQEFILTTARAAIQAGELLFGRSKGTAIASAIINTYEGATKALAQGGFYGIALAAVVIAAGLAQVRRIASTEPQGFQTGGFVRGGVAGADSVPALLTPGEFVLTRELTDFLVEQARSDREPAELTIELGPNISGIVDEVNAEVKAGRLRLVATDINGPRNVRRA